MSRRPTQAGRVFVWEAADRTVFNLGTQPLPRPTAKLEYIRTAVQEATQIAESRSIPVIGMPRIGSGLGGLQWESVRAVLEEVAEQTDVLLAVYERSHIQAR
jgi:O-acetyl-ADP-ribose deacetylase (regulator of RNase III)